MLNGRETSTRGVVTGSPPQGTLGRPSRPSGKLPPKRTQSATGRPARFCGGSFLKLKEKCIDSTFLHVI